MKTLDDLKKLKLGKSHYKVKNGGSPVDIYGEINFRSKTLTLFPNNHPINDLDTLLHELLHAAWYYEKLPERPREESVVTALARGLAIILHDNPGLATLMENHLHNSSGKES